MSRKTHSVALFDKLLARMEVSRTYPMPIISIGLFWVGSIGLILFAKATGTKPVLFGRVYSVGWLVVVALELGRDVWAQHHRYASPRWLQAVHAAVGSDVAVHALADLIRQHTDDSDYVVTRSDMRSAVQAERARRRETARRAEGFRLAEVPVSVGSQTAIDDERRRRARERRAARRAQAAA